MIITIDGPTASGKSTVAKMLAKKLGFAHLNSGLLYRALAYILVNNFGYDEGKLREPEQKDLDQIVQGGLLKYVYDVEPAIIYDGNDITKHLKTKDMDNYSSISSANARVCESLMQIQRQVGEQQNIVAEGRDTGTKVFPNADLKIFLTAKLENRAKHWREFMADKGKNYSLAESIKLVDERDRRDINREVAPLRPVDDGVIIDSSDKTLEEVVFEVTRILKINISLKK